MNQKGYTLLELLVVLAIEGVILLVIVSSIYFIVQGQTQITGKSAAMADIDNAAHWLTRDLILAQTTTLIEEVPPVSEMTLDWCDMTAWAGAEGSVEHTASYIYIPSETRLLRDYNGESITVGRYLTDVGFSVDGKMFTVTLTSCPDGTANSRVTRSFLVQMRAELGP